MCQLAQFEGVNGIRVQEGTKAVANKTDRQGAQLSQECPLPANYQPMGTNNCTAQMSLSSMRPLVPIGLGCASSVLTRQIVSFRQRLASACQCHFWTWSVALRALDSITARQTRRTSLVFCTDLPSSLLKSTGRRLST